MEVFMKSRARMFMIAILLAGLAGGGLVSGAWAEENQEKDAVA